MMTVNSIKNGVVIDHIKAGNAMKLFKYMNLEKTEYRIAMIMNVSSNKKNKKDIIKIENGIDIEYEELVLIDPEITINIIENEKVVKKIKPQLPETVINVIECKNPRCVTSIEKYVDNIFYLSDRENKVYRCKYCDEKHTVGE